MNDNWKTVEIGSLCQDIFDGPHATPKKTNSGPVFLGISNLSSGKLDLTEAEFLSEHDFLKWTRRVTPRPNDVVFSYETRLGEAAMIPEELRCCLGRRMALMRPNLAKVNPRFLLYAFLGAQFQNTIRERTIHGSTVDRIPLIEFGKFPIRIAPLSEQRAISEVLGVLDDKIEVNRRVNKTLEVIARTIFKSWFVDFDPVLAKAEGRQPFGMDAETAALFPVSFQESPLGRMPRAWQPAKISELASLSRDAVNPLDFPLELFDHYSIPSFDDGRRPKEERGETIKSNKFVVPADCVLLSKLNPRIPRIWLPFPRPGRRSVASTEFLVALGVAGCTREFLYGLFSSESFLDSFATLVTGTSGSHQRVKPEFLLNMPVAIPAKDCIRAYTSVVAPMYKLVAANLQECQTLVSLRDVLLPKLISGEIRVKDAAKIIGQRV